MLDPHVVRLRYALRPEGHVSYVSPADLEFTNEYGNFRLAEGILEFYPRDHFPRALDAQQAVAPFIEAWQLSTDLRLTSGELRFVFLDHETIDRSPRAHELQGTTLKAFMSTVPLAGSLERNIRRSQYPAPPDLFRFTADVATMAYRYRLYAERRESLPSMGYFCLTAIELIGGGRRKAAAILNIQERVLEALGRLTAEGDPSIARKLRRGQKPLTAKETAWLEAVVKALILRVGEHAAGGAVQRLTMREFPEL